MNTKKKIWAITGSLAAATLITVGAGAAIADRDDTPRGGITVNTGTKDTKTVAPTAASATNIKTTAVPSAPSPAVTATTNAAVSAPSAASPVQTKATVKKSVASAPSANSPVQPRR